MLQFSFVNFLAVLELGNSVMNLLAHEKELDIKPSANPIVPTTNVLGQSFSSQSSHSVVLNFLFLSV